MKSLTEYLEFEVPGRRGFVNITNTIAALVAKSGVKGGALPRQRHAYHRVGIYQ